MPHFCVHALVPICSLVLQILCVFFRFLLVIEAVCFHFLSSYPVSLIAFTCCLLFSPVIASSSFLCVIPNQLSGLMFSNVFHVHVTGLYLVGTFYILIANSKCCRLQATFSHSVIYINLWLFSFMSHLSFDLYPTPWWKVVDELCDNSIIHNFQNDTDDSSDSKRDYTDDWLIQSK